MKHTKVVLYIYFFISLIFVGYVIGFKNLVPTETEWIFTTGDLISYYLPLYFYNSSEWSLNILENPNYGLEIYHNMFFYDTIKFLNPIFKIFSKIFYSNFQYVSSWQVLNILFQGFFSYKIIYYKTDSKNYSFVSSLFFISAPFFLDRLFIHTFVGSHWLILWSIYLIIKYDIRKSLLKWSLLLFFSVFINIYLSIIIILYLYIYLFFSVSFKKLFFKKLILLYLYFSFLFLLFLVCAGFFSINIVNFPEYGFGHYKSNILTFFDNEGGISNLKWSRIFKNINNFPGEEEGFGYLGFSIYPLIAYLLFYLNYKDAFNKIKIFYIIIFFFFLILSLTHKISFGSSLILDIPLNQYIFGILSFVRASGRFIWVPAYLVLIFLFVHVYKVTKYKQSLIAVLLVLLCLQILDQKGAILELKKKFIIYQEKNLEEEIPWKQIAKNYRHFRTSLVLADPEGVSVNGKIIEKNKFEGTNIVYFARADRKKLAQSRYETFNNIYNKDLDINSVYWIHPDHQNHFIYFFENDENFLIFEFKNQKYIIKKKDNANILFNKSLSKLDLPEIKFNTMLDPENNKLFFGLGWFAKGTFWSDGPRSSFFFNEIPNLKKINFEVEIFNYNKNTIDNYEFYLNQNFIKNFKVTKKNSNYIIELPINYDFQKKVNHLEFINKNRITKADISIYPDPRLLGFRIKKFYFSN